MRRLRRHGSLPSIRCRMATLAAFMTAREAPRVPFAALIESGLIAPGANLVDARRRHRALVRADGAIAFGDAVGSIHRIGALAQGLEACNGWAFWHLETAKGLVPIDSPALRDTGGDGDGGGVVVSAPASSRASRGSSEVGSCPCHYFRLFFPEMTNAQKKALRAHRTRLRKRGLRRVEVTVRAQDVGLLRDVADALREDGKRAQRMRTLLRDAASEPAGPTIAEVMTSLPDISGPEFDAIFEDIDRFRQHPVMMKVRDVDL